MYNFGVIFQHYNQRNLRIFLETENVDHFGAILRQFSTPKKFGKTNCIYLFLKTYWTSSTVVECSQVLTHKISR